VQIPPRILRRRWQFIALFWLVQALSAYFLSLILAVVFLGDSLGDWFGWFSPFGFTVVVLLLQAMFLAPIRKPAVSTRGLPILLSLTMGGAMIAILAMAMAFAVGHFGEVYGWWDFSGSPTVLIGVFLGIWLAATPVLYAFCRRGRREQILQRVSSFIFLGTIVEAAAIIPLDALVRRKEECYCGTGTFLALAMCGSVGFFVFGPAVFLPLVMRHRKRWYGRRCDACGYDMTGLAGAKACPECGAGWKSTSPSTQRRGR
jgi:MFS family permease